VAEPAFSSVPSFRSGVTEAAWCLFRLEPRAGFLLLGFLDIFLAAATSLFPDLSAPSPVHPSRNRLIIVAVWAEH
jgi:hypothetical protein